MGYTGGVETALAIAGAVGLVSGILVMLVGHDVRRYKHAEPHWQRVATQLGAAVKRTWSAMTIDAVLDGRPVRVLAAQTGGRNSRGSKMVTTVETVGRHLDDVVAGTPLPAPEREAWLEAWNDAEVRAGLAELQRPPLLQMRTSGAREGGVVDSDAQLMQMIEAAIAPLTENERSAKAWVDAAAAIGLTLRAAYLFEGELRGCSIRIAADLASQAIVVRAIGVVRDERDVVVIGATEVPGGYEHLPRVDVALSGDACAFAIDADRARARLTSAVREALGEARPHSVIAEQQSVTVIIPGVKPDLARWRAAIDGAIALAGAPNEGAFR